jgi:ABC-2 type transport system permease protein
VSATPAPTVAGAAWAILRNELRLWFLAPAAWVFLASTLFLLGLLFTIAITTTGEASLRSVLPNLGATLVFTLPLVTMRQLAEEARSGTLELVLTAPVPLGSLIVGKWLAALVLCAALLLATLPYPAVLYAYGDPDPGVLLTCYLGLFLCCAAFSAIGLFASSLARDPTVAGVLGVLLLVPSWLASAAQQLAPPSLVPVLQRISFIDHLRSFAQGVLDTGDIAWFLIVTAAALFLTYQSVASRVWR